MWKEEGGEERWWWTGKQGKGKRKRGRDKERAGEEGKAEIVAGRHEKVFSWLLISPHGQSYPCVRSPLSGVCLSVDFSVCVNGIARVRAHVFFMFG